MPRVTRVVRPGNASPLRRAEICAPVRRDPTSMLGAIEGAYVRPASPGAGPAIFEPVQSPELAHSDFVTYRMACVCTLSNAGTPERTFSRARFIASGSFAGSCTDMAQPSQHSATFSNAG